MKQIINKWIRYSGTFFFALLATIGVMILSGCDKEMLNVQQEFPFEIKVMPVPKEIGYGETVEIRVTILSKGEYADGKYYLRYFQNDGKGMLRYFDDLPYQPNDLYPLREKEFRLYYTSESVVSQNLDIWIADNFGNEKQISLQFNSKN